MNIKFTSLGLKRFIVITQTNDFQIIVNIFTIIV